MPLLQNGRSKSARHTGGNGTPLAVALASSLDGRRGFHPVEARWGVDKRNNLSVTTRRESFIVGRV